MRVPWLESWAPPDGGGLQPTLCSGPSSRELQKHSEQSELQASRALLQAAAAQLPASADWVEESELTAVRVEESRTLLQLWEAGVGVDSSEESTTLRGDLRTPGGTHTFGRCLCK